MKSALKQPFMGITRWLGYSVPLVMMFVTVAVAQPPTGPNDHYEGIRPPNLPAEFRSRPTQPAIQVQAETLDTAWAVALQADERIAASRHYVAAAESGWNAARAERLPSVTLGADYYALSETPTMSVSLGALGTERLPLANRDSAGGYSLITQPLYTSGRIANGIRAAEANVCAQQADHSRTILDVKMNVAEIYVTVLRATRIVEVAESRVVSLSGHDKDVTAMYEKELVSRNDLLASHVALADAQQKALDARAESQIAQAAYNRALGRELTQPVYLAELPDQETPLSIDELTQEALSHRPELASLAAQVRALRDEAAGLRGKNGPQVAVTGGYVYQQNDYIQPNGTTGVMLGVEWNAIDFGRVKNQALAMEEKSQALLRLRRDAESMISLEVRQKWIDLQTAQERVLVARKTTAQGDENLRVARDRYQHQVGTNTEVLDAETLRVQAYTNLYNSTYQAVLAALRLRRAAGSL